MYNNTQAQFYSQMMQMPQMPQQMMPPQQYYYPRPIYPPMNYYPPNFVQAEQHRRYLRQQEFLKNQYIADKYMQSEINKIEKQVDTEFENEKNNFKELHTALNKNGIYVDDESFTDGDVTFGRPWISVQYFTPVGRGTPFPHATLHNSGDSLNDIPKHYTKNNRVTHIPLKSDHREFWSIVAGKGGDFYYRFTELGNVAFIWHIKAKNAIIIIPFTNKEEEIDRLLKTADLLTKHLDINAKRIGLWHSYCNINNPPPNHRDWLKNDVNAIHKKIDQKKNFNKPTIWNNWKNKIVN